MDMFKESKCAKQNCDNKKLESIQETTKKIMRTIQKSHKEFMEKLNQTKHDEKEREKIISDFKSKMEKIHIKLQNHQKIITNFNLSLKALLEWHFKLELPFYQLL